MNKTKSFFDFSLDEQMEMIQKAAEKSGQEQQKIINEIRKRQKMIKKRKKAIFKSTCERKIPYTTRAEARAWIKRPNASSAYIYRCPVCKMWHTTRMNRVMYKRAKKKTHI